MSYPVGKGEREALREEHADKAAAMARLGGRTITCEHWDVAAHSTCTGNQHPERCLCPCHDAEGVGLVRNPDETSRLLAALSRWVDGAPANAARDREAALWGRIAKVGEECGEVVAALIGATGQNPRKGVQGSMAEVERELLDVALTALCAVEHLSRNQGESMSDFADHVRFVAARAGVGAVPTEPAGEA